MKRVMALTVGLVLAARPGLAEVAPESVVTGKLPFEQKVVASDLKGPWEITWGPDNFIWVTERTAGRITRVDPSNGAKKTAIAIKDVVAPGGQDGLLGMALHPDLLLGRGHDYVFAAYTYVDMNLPVVATGARNNPVYQHLRAKIVRLTYDPATQTLGDPVDIIAGLLASTDHNSGRLKIGPDFKLYYTIGDGGHDQLANYCVPIEAQTLPTAEELKSRNYFAYQGKSLRLNLDGSIPDDNPTINGVRSHIFTYGHRNMQGIDFAPNGTLYASEHGPKSDDEINILLPGRNYGWPHVSGYRDNKAYQYARWPDATIPCEQLAFSDLKIDPSVPVEDETSWTEPMEDPILTMFTVPSDWNFADPRCKGATFVCWPTVAPSSIETYMPAQGGIPGWENSLLVPTLKRGSIYRIPLAKDGRTLRGPIERYFQTENRYRDTAVSPDKMTIYVATDLGGPVDALAGGVTTRLQNPGAILSFTYNPR
jgi:PQQ-dependent dehydrogenase (s-GDH family)